MIATGPSGRRGAVIACACLGVLWAVTSTVGAARAQGDDRTAAEKQADERRHQALEAQARLERTRALVEDGIARLGRIRAELDGAPSKVAVEVHEGQPKAPTALKGRASASAPAGSANGSTP